MTPMGAENVPWLGISSALRKDPPFLCPASWMCLPNPLFPAVLTSSLLATVNNTFPFS